MASHKKKRDLEAVLAEKEEDILRLRADFENYKKHLDREREAVIKTANERLILELLDVVDNFERALPLIKDEKAIEGVGMIYKQLSRVLECAGLKRIDAKGKRFDPYLHEALMQEGSDQEEDTVLEELQAGYTLNGKVIRHSKVKIAKNDLGDSDGRKEGEDYRD